MVSDSIPTPPAAGARRLLWWLYQPYKYLVYAPMLAVVTLVMAAAAVVLTFVANPRTASRLCGVTWARLLARVTPMRVAIDGREHIDPQRSYVVACNHQSLYDILVLYGWLGIDFRWIMKHELRRVPGLGIACQRMGHIFIDRSNYRSALATIDAAKRRIVRGTSVLFFPEGTRSASGALGPFKRGAFRLAVELALPILPVTIVGTRSILPPHGTDLRPGRARLIIHSPIEIGGTDRSSLIRLMDRVRSVIEEPLGPTAA